MQKFRDAIAWKGRHSLEFKGLKVIGKAFLTLVFLIYLATSALGAWDWAHIQRVRLDDIGGMKAIMQKMIAHGDIKGAEKWMMYRPLHESAYILAHVDPFTPYFSFDTFFNLARRADYLGDDEQRNFWAVLARYRLRYDALRCNDNDIIGGTASLMKIGDARLLDGLPMKENIAVTRRAIAYDEKFPAANDPARTCLLLKSLNPGHAGAEPHPPETWDQIHFKLRYGTDLSLKKAEESLNAIPDTSLLLPAR